MTLDVATFGLAFAAYLALAIDVVLRRRGTTSRARSLVIAALASAHVTMVWVHRFGGSLDRALEKSVAGFVLFHAVFLAILVIAIATRSGMRRLSIDRVAYTTIVIVTLAALPAPWRYPELAWLKVPMVIAAASTAWLAYRAPRPG